MYSVLCYLVFIWLCLHVQWFLGNNRRALHKQLCEAIYQMEVGEVLKSVQDEYCEDFYKFYLHDFVRSVHQSQQKKKEQEDAEYKVCAVGVAGSGSG